jgi:DNA-binding IclR family transcriptional regulator
MEAQDKSTGTNVAAPHKISSFARGMKVFEYVSTASSQQGILEIAKQTGIEKSAVQRVVNSLVQLGYFTKDLQTRKYRIGPKALTLGYGYLATSRLVNAATPYLFQLSEMLDEPLSLSVILDDSIIMISRVRRSTFHHAAAFQGEQQPIYCTASGRAILAHLPRPEADEILKGINRIKLTPATKTDLNDIREELDLALVAGYAVQEDEFTLGEINFGAPVFDGNHRPIAAIVVGVLKSKGSRNVLEQKITPALLNASFAISKLIRLG